MIYIILSRLIFIAIAIIKYNKNKNILYNLLKLIKIIICKIINLVR